MKISRWMAWVLSVAFLAWGAAWGQGSEPTLDQIYQAANSGQVSQARSMIEQVLKNHPKSAKAHYVKAELAARQREAAVAQEELATAERLAPGLPFVKPTSVQALRTQIQDLAAARGTPRSTGFGAAAAPASPGLPWGKIVLGLAIALGVMALIRRMMPSTSTYGAGPGPYGSGMPGTGPAGGPGPGYGPGGVPQPGTGPAYGAPGGQPSMGSTIGRGLATGLAIGAGAVAAEEIGRRIFDHRGNPVAQQDPNLGGNFGLSDPSAMDNVDMGGQDFGVNDAGSWDDNGGGMDAGDIGGGGDWDNS